MTPDERQQWNWLQENPRFSAALATFKREVAIASAQIMRGSTPDTSPSARAATEVERIAGDLMGDDADC